MATRKVKITYTAHTVFLLESPALGWWGTGCEGPFLWGRRWKGWGRGKPLSVFIYQACKIFIMSVYTHILPNLTVKVKRKKGQHTTNKRRQQNRD